MKPPTLDVLEATLARAKAPALSALTRLITINLKTSAREAPESDDINMTTNGYLAKQHLRQRHVALIMLGRGDVFGGADESDFLAWCTFAAARVESEAGLYVMVQVRDAEDAKQHNLIVAIDGADETKLEAAVHRLWSAWLRLSSGTIALELEELDGDADDDGFYDRPTPVRVVPAMRHA
jgi:hypothetical protein